MSVYTAGAPASVAGAGSVFDRLYDPRTYTGVYAERFRSGPGINADAGEAQHSPVRRGSVSGYTNAGTNVNVHDLSKITRDYLNRDPSVRSQLGQEARQLYRAQAERPGTRLPSCR